MKLPTIIFLVLSNIISGFLMYNFADSKRNLRGTEQARLVENVWLNKERQYVQIQATRDSAFAVKDSFQREMILELYKRLVVSVYGNNANSYFESNLLHNVDSMLKVKFPDSHFRLSYSSGEIIVDGVKESNYSPYLVNQYLANLEKGAVYLDAKRTLKMMK